MRARLPRDPFFVIVDFSPSLKAAVRAVFPNARVGHDYFHSAQLLNRGLLKEMMRLYRARCRVPVLEYHRARQASLEAEETGLLPPTSFEDAFLRGAWAAYRDVHPLGKCATPTSFAGAWNALEANLARSSWSGAAEFRARLEALEPKRGFTAKNIRGCLDKARKAWRRVVLEARNVLEAGKSNFTKAKYAALRNPDKVTARQSRKLRKYLKQFPWLRPIREAVVEFHYQFKAPRERWRSLGFLDRIVTAESHPRLKSAVCTLQEEEALVFAYRAVWEEHPELAGDPGTRTNREEFNRRVNKLARDQYGLRDSASARLRIEGVLNCPVFISDALRAYELSHQ